jgi:hypothetical protein
MLTRRRLVRYTENMNDCMGPPNQIDTKWMAHAIRHEGIRTIELHSRNNK